MRVLRRFTVFTGLLVLAAVASRMVAGSGSTDEHRQDSPTATALNRLVRPVADTSGAPQAQADIARLAANTASSAASGQSTGEDFGQPADLPRPSSLTTGEFESRLFPFLKSRRYVELGWRRDKSVRDTGPYLNGVYYGTHPAVRVYYSPGIMRWLVAGRVGTIPDGEMIIKEQYAAPAALHRDKTDTQLADSLESWTVMVKDSQGSQDGWFWSNPGADAEVVNPHDKNIEPLSGFGLYCVRCHASTQSPQVDAVDSPANEFTFAALRNIEGYPGEPILFRVDDSWRSKADASSETDIAASEAGEDAADTGADEPLETAAPDAAFLSLYASIPSRSQDAISKLPPSSHDSVPARRGESTAWATSDQCMSCHAGLTGPLGPVGVVPTSDDTEYGAPVVNVSPYGQWRWTPMGLAGRDPIFLAQLESEVAMIHADFGRNAESEALAKTLVDACLRCHGAMGHQEFHRGADPDAKLSLHDVYDVDDRPSGDEVDAAKGNHGALARDGISCMVCHRMQPRPQRDGDTRPYLQHFLETSITGNAYFGPSGELYGPYKDDELAPYAMHHATGIRPRYSPYIRQSQLCGTCHTVSLPTIDRPLDPHAPASEADKALTAGQTVPEFKRYRHHIEQATYLEWLNSQYNDEVDPQNPLGRSCQSCHMADQTFADEAGEKAGKIEARIAAIQDDTYPDAENLASHDSLRVRVRDEYRRHDFAGLNVGLLQLFKQFSGVLGVKTTDYMTGSDQGADQAIASMVRTAQNQTATVTVEAYRAEKVAAADPDVVEAVVQVTNLAGHRFPSGVGFRRAFIELQVVETQDDRERIVWASGQTNSLGVILGVDGKPLATEFFAPTTDARFQPHHELITSPDQVQIYETLLQDNQGRMTTSFVRGCKTVKDNRLLPSGWSEKGPGGGLTGPYLKATHPGPIASRDPDFTDGSGADQTRYRITLPGDVDAQRVRVQATLYYQATPPYYLNNLFTTAPDAEATQRLHAMASRLQLEGTPIENWKLKVAAASTPLEPAAE